MDTLGGPSNFRPFGRSRESTSNQEPAIETPADLLSMPTAATYKLRFLFPRSCRASHEASRYFRQMWFLRDTGKKFLFEFVIIDGDDDDFAISKALVEFNFGFIN